MEGRVKGKILLTPEQFDAIHIASLVFGGIGAGEWADDDRTKSDDGIWEPGDPDAALVCSIAMLRELESETGYTALASIVPWPYYPTDNDRAVRAINRRRGRKKNLNARVPFLDFVKELNIDITEEP